MFLDLQNIFGLSLFRLPKGSVFIEVQIMDLIVGDKGMSL